MALVESPVERPATWPLTRLDVAGAFGDVAVLFPLAIALLSLNRMNPTAVFLTAGLAYILAGAYFRIPISVQPLKAVAAIALAFQLPPTAIASAGLMMGVLLLLIGVANLAPLLARLFSLPIVRGIQLGLGLLLAREGIRLVFASGEKIALGRGASVPPVIVGLAAAVVLLVLRKSQRFPAALVLLGAGALVGLAAHGQTLPSIAWGPLPLEFWQPSASELKSALLVLVLPQFALTFGNSIVATENTAQILYAGRARRVTMRALSLSIGLANLAAGTLLGAPVCHGSGGVTAHYKFGARSEKSSYVIGGVCLLLAAFGRAAVALLALIPTSVLGVFLVYVGVQHAAFIRDIVRSRRFLLVAVIVGLVSLIFTNLTWGFLVGFALEGVFRLYARLRSRQRVSASREKP